MATPSATFKQNDPSNAVSTLMDICRIGSIHWARIKCKILFKDLACLLSGAYQRRASVPRRSVESRTEVRHLLQRSRGWQFMLINYHRVLTRRRFACTPRAERIGGRWDLWPPLLSLSAARGGAGRLARGRTRERLIAIAGRFLSHSQRVVLCGCPRRVFARRQQPGLHRARNHAQDLALFIARPSW